MGLFPFKMGVGGICLDYPFKIPEVFLLAIVALRWYNITTVKALTQQQN